MLCLLIDVWATVYCTSMQYFGCDVIFDDACTGTGGGYMLAFNAVDT